MPASNSRDPIPVISEAHEQILRYVKKEMINNQKKKLSRGKKNEQLERKYVSRNMKAFQPSECLDQHLKNK